MSRETKKAKARAGECVYCGVAGLMTRDHIPPQGLFQQPRPSNLITVPACDQCNKSYSKDDEWFRLILAITEDVKTNVDRNAILPSVHKSLMRPPAAGFRRAFFKNIYEVPRLSSSGIYMGTQRIHITEGARLDRVAKRITKGLFYHVKGHRLPDNHGVNAIHYSRLSDPKIRGTEFEQMVLEFVAVLSQKPVTDIGETFSYHWLQSPNGLDQTIWLLSFYGQEEYFCSTSPLDEVAPV
jgi:hypothetical protein